METAHETHQSLETLGCSHAESPAHRRQSLRQIRRSARRWAPSNVQEQKAMTVAKALDDQIRERFPGEYEEAAQACAAWLVDQFAAVAAEAHEREQHFARLARQDALLRLQRAKAEDPAFKAKLASRFYDELILDDEMRHAITSG
jgi:hypothetical protein